ncbi:MAG: hypothetical protein V4671_00530 [Armatimonadota bacterium]
MTETGSLNCRRPGVYATLPGRNEAGAAVLDKGVIDGKAGQWGMAFIEGVPVPLIPSTLPRRTPRVPTVTRSG